MAGGVYAIRVQDDRLRPVARRGDWVVADGRAAPGLGDRVIVGARGTDCWWCGDATRTGNHFRFTPCLPGVEPPPSPASELVLLGIWRRTIHRVCAWGAEAVLGRACGLAFCGDAAHDPGLLAWLPARALIFPFRGLNVPPPVRVAPPVLVVWADL